MLFAGLACSGEPAPTPEAEVRDLGEAVATVRPVWAGCNELLDGVCLIWRSRGEDTAKARELRAWLDVAPSTEIAVEIDGVAVGAEAVPADAGVRLHIPIPAHPASILLEGAGVEGSLRLEYLEFGEKFEGAVEAIERGELQAGCAALREIGEHSSWVDRVKAAARIADHCHDGTLADRIRKQEAAAATAASAGYLRTSARFISALAYTQLVEFGDMKAARASAARLEALATGTGETEAWAGYTAMLIADRAGDSKAALDSAARVQRWASRLEMPSESRGALEIQGTILAKSGRTTEAIALARTVADEALRETRPCDRARTLNNATWIHQLLADSELLHDPPYDGMVAVMGIYERGECANPREALHARVNIARAAVAEGEFETAQYWIEAVDGEDPLLALQDLRTEVEDVRAAIALGTGRWEFAPIPLLVRRPQLGSSRVRWQSAARDAQLLERFGLTDAAIAAWSRAEAVVESTVVAGPNGAEYISGRARSIRGLVEALVAVGRPDEALCRARVARGRALRSSSRAGTGPGSPPEVGLAEYAEFLRARDDLAAEASEDWRYAVDEQERRRARRLERQHAQLDRVGRPSAEEVTDCHLLRPRDDDELVVLVFPTDAATLVLADSRNGVVVHRHAPIPEDSGSRLAWAAEVLEELSAELEHSRAIRFLPVGRAWEVEFHGAQWRGEALPANAAVAYALDLPRLADGAQSADALVVADPTGDLPRTLEEVEVILPRLRTAGWRVEPWTGATITRSMLAERLAHADLFHYAGHGLRGASNGWEAALLLGDEQTMDVRDVLALEHAPRWAVLTACDSGSTSAGLVDGGMSLGRAFLLAGAHAVVVTDRPIEDRLAVAVGAGLYESAERAGFDPVAALGRVQAASSRAEGSGDWAAFRVLVR